LLEALTQLGEQGVRREGRFGSHGRGPVRSRGESYQPVILRRGSPQLTCSRKICHTRLLGYLFT
jgi:hypothetical protein